ncbi:hypothetical protein HDV06_001836 [Boothiomyces sp. JEL0866]|nr:hypothetical protein HDV06_001836 [Boothiomyces sp. JEL0866]
MLNSFIFLGFLLSVIPLYIVKFGGSVESFSWKFLGFVSFIPGVVLLFIAKRIDGQSFSILYYILVVIVMVNMVLSSFITWKKLRGQQLIRRQQFHDTASFDNREERNHKASILMMKFIIYFTLFNIALLSPIVVAPIVYAIIPDIESSLFFKFVELAYDIIFLSTGLFHALGVEYAFNRTAKAPVRTIVGFNTSGRMETPTIQILSNSPQSERCVSPIPNE